MVFSSASFLLYFLPIFLLVYHLLNARYRNLFILFASIVFYAWGAPLFIFVILVSTIIDFYIVQKLYESKQSSRKKLFLVLSISINLGLLLYFKYANFFVENLNELFVLLGGTAVGWTKVLLPIGISFYTFQTLTYSIDIYRGKSKPLKKLSDYLLYILSFPQMIAGPIVRYNEISDQITNRKEKVDDKLIGIIRFSIGLAKKVLIANVMGEQTDIILGEDLSTLGFGDAWLGILAYTFQIYFDFSGYSDMAIGLGKMMGFRFPENFDSPYTARSISEFWRRWHITLGQFMRDYLYIPLGGNRVNTKARLYFNLILVFILSGLWHGASWNFVLWGAFHGVFLILDRLFLLSFLKRCGNILSTVITFFIVVMGWVLFRIERFDDATIFYTRLFSFDEFNPSHLIPSFASVFAIAIFFSFLTSFNYGKKIGQFLYERNVYSLKQYISLIIISVIFLLLGIASITGSDFNPFIYYRF